MSQNKMAAISIRAPPCRTGTISWNFTTLSILYFFKKYTWDWERLNTRTWLICVLNINVITSREKYLCLIKMFNIAHSWPGTSVPVRPVWHTGAQNWTLYYEYIYIKFRLFLIYPADIWHTYSYGATKYRFFNVSWVWCQKTRWLPSQLEHRLAGQGPFPGISLPCQTFIF